MAQTTQLVSSEKSVLRIPAQVIALDPRPDEKSQNSKKYLRILQLSDLLSRHLEIPQIIEAFMAEIAIDVEQCGYRFRCDDVDLGAEALGEIIFTAAVVYVEVVVTSVKVTGSLKFSSRCA